MNKEKNIENRNAGKRIYAGYTQLDKYDSLKDILFLYPQGERLNRYWCNEYHISHLLGCLLNSFYYRHLIKDNKVEEAVRFLREDASSLTSFISVSALEQNILQLEKIKRRWMSNLRTYTEGTTPNGLS